MSESTSRTVPEVQGERGGVLSHRQIMTILAGLLLGMLLAALDMTIMGSATKTIADQLHGQTIQAWVTTAYLITSTISTPLYGKLSDILGRKPMYLTAITLFLAGSVLSAMATSMYELAAFRAVQGLGAGGLMSLALAILADLVSPRERSKYQGYFMAVWGTSSVLGPVIGGFFAGAGTIFGVDGWRWVFLVNVPLGIVALFVVARFLNVPHARVNHRVDYWGAAALTVMLVPLLIVAEQGRVWGWDSGAAWAMYGLGVVGLVAFVFVERLMGDEALLPLRLFRRPVFSLTNIINFVMGIGMFGMMMSLPLYLQIVKGATPTESGLQTLPMTAGILVASMGSGILISKTGRYKRFPIAGLFIVSVSMFLFAQIGVDTPLVSTMLIMGLAGLGLGLCMQTLILAIQNDVPAKDMGVATSSATFFRSIGGTVGTAVFLSILFGLVGEKIAGAFTAVRTDPAFLAAAGQNPEFAKMLQGGGGGLDLNNTEFLNSLDPTLARPILTGFAESIDTVFMVGGFVTLVAFVLMWFLKETPLSDKSGIQRVADDEAAAAAPAIAH
ncbi:MDR family MFS transporter [Actinophytocola algeriensis]|uniref:EmrB/QacA subfamily drug resistance transporter n=1 Tax=Actinophytocola algeriensis TaxID=1768010 RepID=A0A7W7Q5Q8_9PSEU|nr:MDR family MFS transporter [Actinophytocola algeriensis]MBB4907204.1 EmrB/QacA subfamily drug resistance transporter [Actinophytocola algeriensis]MBE1478687.1 EmrB/QacA subfamily drug resistance transporter [Actinophytocola algeriensis]